jgi:hypothetical protein
MKDSIRLMEIYRKYLETTGELIEVLEGHCRICEANNISDALKKKYAEYRKHTSKLVSNLNDDLHILLRIDYELKDIECIEDKKKAK